MRALRITVVGKFFPDSFAHCIAEAAREAGHTVQRVDDQYFPSGLAAPRLRMAWSLMLEHVARVRDANAARVAREVTGFEPDLVISTSKTLPPEAVREIRDRSSACLAFWFPDAISNLGRQFAIASPFDLYCFKDRLLVEVMRKRIGLPAFLLPDAARRVGEYGPIHPPDCEILIACNLYPYRARLLECLEDFDLRIYGNRPRWLRSSLLRFHTGEYLAGERKMDAYRRAAIVLNNNHFAEIDGINARTFEVCGSGGFLLTDNHPALGEYYEPGVEVGVFEGVEDLPDRVRFYLARPELRHAMARRAFERTAREHLYTHRVERLLEYAGLRPVSSAAA